MLRLYDFKCPAGHIEEHMVKSDDTHVRCSCGEEARRIISPINFQLEGVSGHFPTAADRWARDHEIAAKKGAKRNQ